MISLQSVAHPEDRISVFEFTEDKTLSLGMNVGEIWEKFTEASDDITAQELTQYEAYNVIKNLPTFILCVCR